MSNGKRDAILNIDLDFFTYPIYEGSGYVKPDWSSYSDHQARSKKWLSVSDFINKFKLSDKSKPRGASVVEDKQALFNIQKIVQDGHIEPGKFDVVHVDAHHDLFSWYPKNHYRKYGIFNYQNFDSNIALFREEWVKKLIWVVPDPMTNEDIDRQFSFRPEISRSTSDNYRFICHYVDDTPIDVDIVRYRRWEEKYNWRYINIVMNKKMSNYNPQHLEELRKYLSVW